MDDSGQNSQGIPVVAPAPVPVAQATVVAQSTKQADPWPDAVIAQGNPWQPAITGWIVVAILLGMAAVGLRKLKAVPEGLQNLWEFTYEWVEDISLQVVGPEGPSLMPFFFSAFVFILACNLLGSSPSWPPRRPAPTPPSPWPCAPSR